jgi:hypothetical protein
MLRMCVYMHSRFIENHPIRILKDGPLISEGVLSQMWQDNLSVVIKTFSKFHIDVWITEIDGRMWRFTGFYGEPNRALRRESWCIICFLRNESDLPWLCA